MELEQLKIFLAVAETGSFTKGAKKLYISHSTTSRAVSALEDELGLRLFERGNKIFSLTEAGELLRKGAEELLAEEDKLRLRLTELKKQAKKTGES